jgi:hypothetical protein
MRKRVERMGRRWGMARLLIQYFREDDMLSPNHSRIDLLFCLWTKCKECDRADDR